MKKWKHPSSTGSPDARKITNYKNWQRRAHCQKSCPRETLEHHGFVLVAQIDRGKVAPREACLRWLAEHPEAKGEVIYRTEFGYAWSPELEIYTS